jgi:hypothetical protein
MVALVGGCATMSPMGELNLSMDGLPRRGSKHQAMPRNICEVGSTGFGTYPGRCCQRWHSYALIDASAAQERTESRVHAASLGYGQRQRSAKLRSRQTVLSAPSVAERTRLGDAGAE